MRLEQEMVQNFVSDRPILAKANLSNPLELLHEEISELTEAVNTHPEEVGQELVDCMWYLLLIANSHGVDMERVFREKSASTHAKYPASKFQEGDFEEIHAQCREDWANGGKESFWDIE